jgi:hypothetical protein
LSPEKIVPSEDLRITARDIILPPFNPTELARSTEDEGSKSPEQKIPNKKHGKKFLKYF